MEQKPLEIYLFVDPTCPDCWALEPIIKKLNIEYGPYLRIKHVLSVDLSSLNNARKKLYCKTKNIEDVSSKSNSIGKEMVDNPITSPFVASVAIKAAELQGKRAGTRFLRMLQEQLFIKQLDVSDFDVLKMCADEAKLDLDEFFQDMHSASASKAFQCDVKIASEMDVESTPTLVFFNENIEDEGIKIDGVYPYEVYVQIVEEMLLNKPEKQQLPSMDAFLEKHKLVATPEVATVYNLSLQQAEKELKKRMFQQKIELINTKHGAFWRHLE
ncbi:DsbA family protein [Jeotgalibacillus sp. S-D1]|nr:DsbA family protein [Jeotgalibacillus sp. S-D1]